MNEETIYEIHFCAGAIWRIHASGYVLGGGWIEFFKEDRSVIANIPEVVVAAIVVQPDLITCWGKEVPSGLSIE